MKASESVPQTTRLLDNKALFIRTAVGSVRKRFVNGLATSEEHPVG